MTRLPERDVKALKRDELARANELLSQIKTELRVLESRRADIRAGIEAETETLKARRVEELGEVERVINDGLPKLRLERQDLTGEISKLDRRKEALEADIVGLETELTAYRQRLGQLSREFDQVKVDKEKAEAHVASANARVATIQATINPLAEDVGHLKDEVRILEARRDEVNADILATQRRNQLKRDDLALEIAGLERKRRELATDISSDAHNIERAREDITTRMETLAKQEKLVRAREYKVAQNEEKIAANIGLLNL